MHLLSQGWVCMLIFNRAEPHAMRSIDERLALPPFAKGGTKERGFLVSYSGLALLIADGCELTADR